MSQRTKRAVLLAKVEVTYNSDPTPTESLNAVQVFELSWGLAALRKYQRLTIGATLAALPKIYGGALFTLSFKTELKGSGAAGTAPDWGVLMEGCSCLETISAGVSVTYEPVSTNDDSLTFYLYEDGKRYIVTGARGNVTFEAPTGQPGMLTFTFTGHLGTDSDTALVTPTLDATKPIAFNSAGVTIGAYTPKFNTLAFDMGNVVEFPPDANASDGYGEILIIDRGVIGSIDPEDDLLANVDFLGDLQGDTARAIGTGVIGSVAGNRWQLTHPSCTYNNWAPTNRNGLRVMSMSYDCGESGGDDEFSLVIT